MELYKFAGISGQAIKSITQYLLRVSGCQFSVLLRFTLNNRQCFVFLLRMYGLIWKTKRTKGHYFSLTQWNCSYPLTQGSYLPTNYCYFERFLSLETTLGVHFNLILPLKSAWDQRKVEQKNTKTRGNIKTILWKEHITLNTLLFKKTKNERKLTALLN